MNIARKKVAPPEEDAEDVVQNIFVAFLANYRTIKKRSLGSIEAYVVRMTKNECLDFRNKDCPVQYWVSEQSIQQLQLIPVGKEVLKRLQEITLSRPVGEHKFKGLLMAALGELLTTELETLILRYCRHVSGGWQPLSDDITQRHLTRDVTQHEVEQRELILLIAEIVSQFDEREFEIFEKRFLQEKPYRTVSDEVGIALSRVHSQGESMITKLRQHQEIRIYWEDIKKRSGFSNKKKVKQQ